MCPLCLQNTLKAEEFTRCTHSYHVDWQLGVVGTMGIQIRADLYDKGYGQEILKSLFETLFDAGLKILF